MATETTPSSSLMRYRPVVLSIAGFAAAYGVYLVYTHLQSTPPPAGIHRSNAVHRPRRAVRPLRRQEAQSAEAVANQASETPDFNLIDTYGRWDIVNGNGQTVQIDLRPNSLPTLDSLQQEHGLSREQAQATLVAIHREFVSRFIMMQLQNRGARANWEQEALAATQWLGQSGIPGDAIGQGLEQMTRVVEQEATAPADTADETDTIGGTEVAAIQFRRAGSGLNLKQLLYHIAETEARQHGFLHRGFRCDSCGTTPIRGTRWKCANCVDLDLCNDCHATCMHNRNHIFYEIRIPTYAMSNLHPVQEVSYPGRLDLSKVPTLPANICKDLVDASDFEKAEIEGLYDQFTCLASSPRPSDPLQFGIDRHTFQQAIVPLSSNSPLRSNLIFDRMFMLFDTDRDGIISFEEFIMGVAFLRSKPGGRSRWKKIFDAYDFDEDGFVSRSDFLRMFRALFTIQKGITQDLLSLSEVENGLRDATSFASTGRVISSAFTQNPRSVPEPRSPLNKSRNEFGDVRDQPGQAVVKEDSTLHINQEEIVGNSWESQAQFPFDHRTGEPLSIREFLYLAPRDQRGQAPSHIARDQKVRFTYDGQSIAEARRVAWQERLQRQRFYTEYEEAAQEQNLETAEIGGYEIPVHVQDLGGDIMYQVMKEGLNELLDPLFKPKEDQALEVESAKSELERWKTEIETYNNRKREEQEQAERAARDPLMATAAAAETAAKEDEDAAIANRGANGHPPGPRVVPSNQGISMADTVASIEEQVQAQPLGELLDSQGFGVREEEPVQGEDTATHVDITTQPSDEENPRNASMRINPSGIVTGSSVFTAPSTQSESHNDPTMPQFMPNSEHDIVDARPRDVTVDPLQPPISQPSSITESADPTSHRPKFEAEIIKQFEYMFLGWNRDATGKVANGTTKKTMQQTAQNEAPDNTAEAPSEHRLARLSELQVAQQALEAHGPGKINFAEFEEFLAAAKGSDFKFLEGWLEVCYF